MPSNSRRNNKGGGRKPRSNVVTSLSASQAWDRKLATSKDVCHVVDRIPLGAITTTAAGTFSLAQQLSVANNNGSGGLSPGIFGQRVFSIGLNFLRWRINRLLVCYRPAVGTATNGLAAVGVADDAYYFQDLGTTPLTSALVQELRCSHSTSIYREIEVEWRPIDHKNWYYVDPVASNSAADSRLEWPGTLCTALVNAPGLTLSAQIDLYYDITFEGEDSQSGTP